MHTGRELAVKRRRILLVYGIFNYRIKLLVLDLCMCLFLKGVSNDKYLLKFAKGCFPTISAPEKTAWCE